MLDRAEASFLTCVAGVSDGRVTLQAMLRLIRLAHRHYKREPSGPRRSRACLAAERWSERLPTALRLLRNAGTDYRGRADRHSAIGRAHGMAWHTSPAALNK